MGEALILEQDLKSVSRTAKTVARSRTWVDGGRNRWHIWSNLAEAVEKTVVQHRALRGYPGGENVVKKYVAKLRENFPHDPPRKAPNLWLTRHPDRLTDDQTQQLKAILVRCPATRSPWCPGHKGSGCSPGQRRISTAATPH
ncbi:hypothetical protein ACFRU3_45640 [Streptomyces sp. NPDC056910]|uniref:hypothetical protein n=1 Tax=Streptomyces sp. NPDC056910 TaxID=3345964 RepID=UPI0036799E40